MGQTLSSPVTEKTSDSGSSEKYLYSVSEMQGWRITMEDAHATILSLADQGDDGNAFFAVYDGHGGSTVASYAGTHVHRRLVEEDAYKEQDWKLALKRAFLDTDEDIRQDPDFVYDSSGCTAVAALLTRDRRIFVANAGDSRSVLSVKGEAKALSYDHKPMNEVERNRIINAGGFIEYGRVNGNLALSRALGDFTFKKNYSLTPEAQIITADPDITEHQLTDDDEFLVLACDGIWDCLQSQQVVDIIRLQVSQRKELSEITEFICELCLAPDTSTTGLGCDNMTVMIVALLNGRTKEQWYDWVADRVERQYGYATPAEVPQLYAPIRLAAFRARRQAQSQRGQENGNDNGYNGPQGSLWRGSGALGLARSVLGHSPFLDPAPPFSGHPWGPDESSDDDDDEEVGPSIIDSHTFFSSLGIPEMGIESLKAQLKELEESEEEGSSSRRFEEVEDDHEMGGHEDDEESKDSAMIDPDDDFGAKASSSSQGGASRPPPTTNGDASTLDNNAGKVSRPSGDKPSAVVKAEGLMDTSEDPLAG